MRYGLWVLLAFSLAITSCGGELTPTAPPVPTRPVVNALADVALRSGPGLGYSEVAQVSKGAPVDLLGSGRGSDCADWVLVRTPEGQQGWVLPIQSGAARLLCVTLGDYCYDLTDGEKHETGSLYFPGGECTCWHWGGGPPTAGSCRCSDDPSLYQRP